MCVLDFGKLSKPPDLLTENTGDTTAFVKFTKGESARALIQQGPLYGWVCQAEEEELHQSHESKHVQVVKPVCSLICKAQDMQAESQQ